MRTLKPLAASAAVLLILCTTGFTTAQDSSDQALASFAAAVASGLSAAVTAADGPTDTTGATAWQAGDSTPPSSGRDVNVTLSGSGLGVAVKGNDGSNFRLGLGNGQLADDLMTRFAGVTDDVMNILMPWLPNNTTNEVVATSGPMLSAAGSVKSAVHQAVASHVADKINFAIKQSDLIKETMNKEINDYINHVNSASNLIQGLIQSKGQLMRGAAGTLGQGIGSIRSVVAGIKEEAKKAVQDKVENLSGLASQFTSLSSSMLGDMGSTASLLTDAASSKAKAFKDIYTTKEGLVKAHIDATVQKKVDALNSLLDKFLAAANAVSTSDMTGPVIDWKLSITQTKLSALEAALDRLAAAVKATPTPSQIHDAKLAFLGSTRIGQAVKDPEAALSQMMGKISQVKSAITSKIAAAKMG